VHNLAATRTRGVNRRRSGAGVRAWSLSLRADPAGAFAGAQV